MALQASFWYNYSMQNSGNLLDQDHPWEQLEQLADAANFVIISGLAVDVDDLIDAIHGRKIDPLLTRAELNTAYAIENSGFLERVGEGMKRRVQNLKTEKIRRIGALLRQSSTPMENGVTNIKLPRREQVLIALSQGKLRYNSLTEFLGQFVQLTEQEAGVVAQTLAEVRGDLNEARPASKISAQKIKEVFPKETIEEIEQTLETDTVVDHFPIFLLERAILEIPPHEDDYQYFEEVRDDRGVRVDFVVESAVASAAFAVPMFTFVGSVVSIGTGWISPEMLDVILGPTGGYLMGGGAAIKVAQTFSKWTPITDRLRASKHTKSVQRSANKLKGTYEELAENVEALKKSATGCLKLLALKELILAHRDGGDHDSARQTVLDWLQILSSNLLVKYEFEDFAKTRRSDLSTFGSAKKVWEEFPHYQAAVQSLPEVRSDDWLAAITAQVRKLPQ